MNVFGFISMVVAYIIIGSMINAEVIQATADTMRDTIGVRYLGEET